MTVFSSLVCGAHLGVLSRRLAAAFCLCIALFAPTDLARAQTPESRRQAEITTLTIKGAIIIQRLNALNSLYHENNISLTPDGAQIFFMSDRGEQAWSRRPDSLDRFDGDIWTAKLDGDEWQAPVCLDSSINSPRGEDEPTISPDGRTVYFQSWRDGWQENGGPYYSAKADGATWGKPKGLGGGIAKFFRERRAETGDQYGTDGAAVSPDGAFFIVACGPDYDGPMDLYFSRKTADGWTYCQPMSLPADGNERSAFIAADGETVYFASDGLGGFGGLDIFKATLTPNGALKDIVNIGEPFNTKADDYGFMVEAGGEKAYFIRNGDIYKALLPASAAALKPKPVLVVSGVVRDGGGKPIQGASVSFAPEGGSAQAPLVVVQTDDEGYYAATLRAGVSYRQTIAAEGYRTERRAIGAQKTRGFSRQESDITLKK